MSPNLKSFAKDTILLSVTWSRSHSKSLEVTRSRSSSRTTLIGDLPRTRDFAFPGNINFKCDALKPG